MASSGRADKRKKYGQNPVPLIILAACTVIFVILIGPPPAFNLAGWWSTDTPPVSRTLDSAYRDIASTDTGTMLMSLPVREDNTRQKIPRYDREAFGARWADIDHNGCDTRNDILSRDLSQVTYKKGTKNCVVLSGKLQDPYTGQLIDFERGNETSKKIQIDHIVPLANAWASGAWEWDEATREKFANDPENLLAVDGPANQEKSAKTADEWLPKNKDFHCDYVKRQVKVKYAWKLSVTNAERDAIANVLHSQCPTAS
ncbi:MULTISPECIES: HNH endonuclease family protein [unclassified Schaalia]|uniref:HNH endonuclease family protein n=1 Tax=unclassified Schaalia TaxID=2691889 RepID=UPI001E5FF9E6|nr:MULTISPECIES: HNH endonuclease family protein [unclassified Schaalia]MCD4550115.1 HNH endonuclease family protein [Schaalia sp. lx-260]MCD4557818.1 HNH endonuclease family protein [Schaalia sp. lx-100]